MITCGFCKNRFDSNVIDGSEQNVCPSCFAIEDTDSSHIRDEKRYTYKDHWRKAILHDMPYDDVDVFQDACAVTMAKYTFIKQGQLTHALGLVGETIELMECDDPEKGLLEGGDCLWYVAMLSYTFGLRLSRTLGVRKFSEFPISNEVMSDLYSSLIVQAGKIGEFSKKYVSHGHTFSQPKYTELIQGYVQLLGRILHMSIQKDLEDAAHAVIEKLKARYPRGFEAHLSRIRKEDHVSPS